MVPVKFIFRTTTATLASLMPTCHFRTILLHSHVAYVKNDPRQLFSYISFKLGKGRILETCSFMFNNREEVCARYLTVIFVRVELSYKLTNDVFFMSIDKG